MNAIAAMQAVDNLSYSTDPKEFARIIINVRHAAIQLQIYSHLDDVEIEIEIEKEAA